MFRLLDSQVFSDSDANSLVADVFYCVISELDICNNLKRE